MQNFKLKSQIVNQQFNIYQLLIFLFFFLLFAFSFSLHTVQADFPVATNLEINDTDLKDGMIISSTGDGLKKSKSPYDAGMVGVIISNPTIVIHPQTDKTKAVISGGDNLVLVNKKNGNIKKGDFITSSDIPGVGQKAISNGYVVAIALDDFPKSGDNSSEGLIKASINIHFDFIQGSAVGLGGLDQIGQSLLNRVSNPTEFVKLSRYLIAALVAIIAILLAFFSFARSVRNGIEAMGRNPLARASIQRGMIINAFLTAVIALFGLAAAYLIIRFF